jgi:signal transduction histidine kinase
MFSFHRSDPSGVPPARPAPLPSAAGGRSLRSRRGRIAALAPLVAGVLTLATLAAVPWTVNSRLTSVRVDMNATVFPARRLVRDFADALAFEVATRSDGATRSSPELASRYAQAVATEQARDAALVALAPRLGNRLAGDIAHLHALTAQWHAEGDGPAAEMTITDILAVAQHLDAELSERQAGQRARIRSLEALDIVLPSVLVPLLAAVLVAIYWTGRRMAALANEAEQSHLALAAASEQKVTLLRGLTHDLKNALGAAGGFATLLREEIVGPLTAKQRHSVERIGHIIEQTMMSVEDALLVARTEAGTLPLRCHTEAARTLVLEAAADYVAAAERAHLTLDVECAGELAAIHTDAALVTKIIGNLLSNAIKYTAAGGRILVRCGVRPSREGSDTGPWVVIEVRDTGQGIPAALHEQIFDEFFRAPAAASTTRGEGIGLAMSRRVARLLGGEITLDSEDGRGATFSLWLPASAHETAHAPRHADAASRLDDTSYDGSRHSMKEVPP